ncbi:hypothetical protein AVDCRST_MAG81-4150 [uncultured Synechococcales cyanobacterium]|uniref:Uncharacterized protein n=1 Tax=uncultured Synechococcales cyanobacterium TaxID=1936017 RepID=A0A6J4VS16_9CYAN|nr:hypothetical protein AVDCRST_MAG81-4150 [uncultured Synechococcales cyanobacterium]
MTNAREIPFEQIRTWVRAEHEKGRPMKETVTELATRDDVTLLFVKDSPEVTRQKLNDSIKAVG